MAAREGRVESKASGVESNRESVHRIALHNGVHNTKGCRWRPGEKGKPRSSRVFTRLHLCVSQQFDVGFEAEVVADDHIGELVLPPQVFNGCNGLSTMLTNTHVITSLGMHCPGKGYVDGSIGQGVSKGAIRHVVEARLGELYELAMPTATVKWVPPSLYLRYHGVNLC